MGYNDRPDGAIEGQMSLEDIFLPPQRLVAVSRIFARARKNMTLAEQKTFVYALSELRFSEEAKSEYVKLDKKLLANILGYNASDAEHLSVNLYNAIKELPQHSFLDIAERDIGLYSCGFFVTSVTRFKNVLRLRFNGEYLSLFTGLSTDYITMWSADIFQMQSRRSVQFYEYLRQITDSRKDVNDVLLGIRALKEMFEIPESGKGSYMRSASEKSKGGFDRANFEKFVIMPLCDDLKNCRMINLILQDDGLPYEKVKRGNRVIGYRFHWAYTAHPAIATAEEVHELQERVDKNPQILKAARDIVTGDKRAKRGEKKNAFNAGVQNHDYDWPAFEEELLSAQDQQLPGQASIEDYPDFMP